MKKIVTLAEALNRIVELEKENAKLKEEVEYYKNRKTSGRQKHNAKWMAIYNDFVVCYEGGFLGELINIEKGFEKLGGYIKRKTGNSRDDGFVNGFMTASLTVCIGAMAIIGSIKDGISSIRKRPPSVP